jgi:plasmid stability protein
MPTITVKNIPDDIYEDLKRSATLHRRSINSEVVVCIEKAVRGHRLNPNEFIHRVEALRNKIDLPPLTDEILRQAKEEVRP